MGFEGSRGETLVYACFFVVVRVVVDFNIIVVIIVRANAIS